MAAVQVCPEPYFTLRNRKNGCLYTKLRYTALSLSYRFAIGEHTGCPIDTDDNGVHNTSSVLHNNASKCNWSSFVWRGYSDQ